jgi:hypothetical protein
MRKEPYADEQPGRFTGNVFVLTGQNAAYDPPTTYCVQEALDEDSVPEGFVVADNLFYANREEGGRRGSRDLPKDEFFARLGPVLGTLKAQPALAGSRFLRDFGSVVPSDGAPPPTP